MDESDWTQIEKLSSRLIDIATDVDNAPTPNHAMSGAALCLAYLLAYVRCPNDHARTLFELILKNQEVIEEKMQQEESSEEDEKPSSEASDGDEPIASFFHGDPKAKTVH